MLPPVLVHTRRALLIELAQHGTVVAVVIAALAFDPFSAITVSAALLSWYLVRKLLSVSASYVKFLTNRSHPEEHERIRYQVLILTIPLIVCWSAVVVVFILTGGAARLHALQAAPVAMRASVVVATIMLVTMVAAAVRQRQIDRLRPGAEEPSWSGNRRLVALHTDSQRPVTVYSGFRPFVGSGLELVTWSLALPLLHRPADDDRAADSAVNPADLLDLGDPADPDGDNPGFSAVDLVRFVGLRIQRLAREEIAEIRLPGLTVQPHIFVAGTYAYDIPEQPRPDDFVSVIADTTTPARHYLACQIPSWSGEIVTTVYVHVSLQGRTLYLEFTTRALPPTVPEFHVVDTVGGTGPRAYLRTCLDALWTLPEMILRTPHSAATVARWLKARRPGGERWRSLQRRRVDIGAKVSAREMGASVDTEPSAILRLNTDINYFQYRDVVKHSKVIERRLISAVKAFLEEEGIDTEEYQQRTVTILNSGVINTGGGNVTVNGVVGDSGTVNNGQSTGGEA